MDDVALTRFAADLAHKAAQVILDVRARGFEVIAKSDRSPVTEADHAAEVVILQALRAATPSIPVVAEEEVAAGIVTEPASAFWLVDPLDGTREFAAGRDDFTINIGLVRDGVPALGVVGVPAYGEIFMGIPGYGAWKRDATGRETSVHVRPVPPEGVTVLASRHHGSDRRLQEFLRDYKVDAIRHMGSGVKFCRVAEGIGDLYPRFGRTMEWDTAAPQAVLEAAGGAVHLFDGRKMIYGKPAWENPSFYCTGWAA